MERLWRLKNSGDTSKKQKSTKIVQTNLLLPNQIGCKIIQMEIEMMQVQNLSKQTILELLHQYSKAVQFYEERGSPKYLLYQKKMQGFLMKPAISQILRGKTGTMLIKKQKNQQQLKKVQDQSHLVAKKLLQDSKQSGQKQQDIIRQQLQNQQKNLEQRIQRKRAISNRSAREKTTAASFSVPANNQFNQKNQQVLISEFMQLPDPNPDHNTEAKNNVAKVFI